MSKAFNVTVATINTGNLGFTAPTFSAASSAPQPASLSSLGFDPAAQSVSSFSFASSTGTQSSSSSASSTSILTDNGQFLASVGFSTASNGVPTSFGGGTVFGQFPQH